MSIGLKLTNTLVARMEQFSQGSRCTLLFNHVSPFLVGSKLTEHAGCYALDIFDLVIQQLP